MAASDKSQNSLKNVSDVSPEQANYLQVQAFANGHGPILSKADQKFAIEAGKGHEPTHFLTSNEALLEQLRADAKAYEKKAPGTLAGLSDPRDYSERQRKVDEIWDHERGILQDVAQVKGYTPQQLKDIGELADAANDPKKLHQIMMRFHDPVKFTDLQEGLRLEMERRGGKVELGTGFYSNGHGDLIPTLAVSRPGSNAFKIIDGSPHTRTAAELAKAQAAFHLEQ